MICKIIMRGFESRPGLKSYIVVVCRDGGIGLRASLKMM